MSLMREKLLHVDSVALPVNANAFYGFKLKRQVYYPVPPTSDHRKNVLSLLCNQDCVICPLLGESE